MIEVTKQVDELTIERWSFYFMYNKLFLDRYCLMHKESKRERTYKVIGRYNRLSRRDSSIGEIEVPLPEDVKQEAFNKFISEIKVLKWSENGR